MRLTQQQVKAAFMLEGGWLYWIAPKSPNLKPGDRAGTMNERGYIIIRWNGKPYKAHRLIFLYVNGYMPKFVDHCDRDKANNEPDNLRGSDAKKNGCNKSKASGKSSCYKGVCRTNKGRWRVQICKAGKIYYLGTFDDEAKAAKCYNKAARKLHGRFASLNVF